MKPRVEPVNPWELLNRARKCGYIVLAIEDWGHASHHSRAEIVRAVRGWDDAMWRRISVAAGQNPPSDHKTKDAVVGMLEERARRSA